MFRFLSTDKIWRNEGEIVNKLEIDFNCFLEPNIDMNLIVVQCDDSEADKVKKEVEGIIDNLRKQIINEVKEIPYYNDTKFVMERYIYTYTQIKYPQWRQSKRMD